MKNDSKLNQENKNNDAIANSLLHFFFMLRHSVGLIATGAISKNYGLSLYYKK